PDLPCHITQRGVDRREVFSTDQDRTTYLSSCRKMLSVPVPAFSAIASRRAIFPTNLAFFGESAREGPLASYLGITNLLPKNGPGNR
ncbi:MAG TPA: hypothetical protein VF532_02350, partial [Candidatus Angelobacter sp.]